MLSYSILLVSKSRGRPDTLAYLQAEHACLLVLTGFSSAAAASMAAANGQPQGKCAAAAWQPAPRLADGGGSDEDAGEAETAAAERMAQVRSAAHAVVLKGVVAAPFGTSMAPFQTVSSRLQNTNGYENATFSHAADKCARGGPAGWHHDVQRV